MILLIKIDNITKSYGDVKSLSGITAKIDNGSIYGLIGSNGSGKSTLLRIMCGIMTPDTGRITYNGQSVYENTQLKQDIIFLSDEQFFVSNSTLLEMGKLYSTVYKNFSTEKFNRLVSSIGLDMNRKISGFSKGMKKQASIILGVSSCPKYLLCDETFDGIDPVMRQFVKKIFADEVIASGITPIIASHNLREIEDICDHIGLLHKGELLFESDLDSLKSEIHTIQAVFEDGMDVKTIFENFKIVSVSKRGSLTTVVVRGDKDEIDKKVRALNLQFFEIIPLTLEEIFISEMEERGYDYSNVIL